MKALILAAGLGSRLAPLTNDRPKCLVKVRGRPILEYQIQTLKSVGVDEIALVTGYRSEMLTQLGMKTYKNKKYKSTNMVYSFFCAENEFTDDVIVSYGDIIYEPRILKKVIESEAPISVAVDEGWFDLWSCRMEDPLKDAETLRLDDKGNIVEIGRKPSSFEEIEGQYMGLIKIKASAISELVSFYRGLNRNEFYDGKDFENMYMTSFIQLVINRLMPVKAVIVKNGWLEVDTIEDLKIYDSANFDKRNLFNFHSFE